MYNNMNAHFKAIELAGTVTVGPKGQVVIPADVREKMSIGPGSKLIALYLPHKKSVGFVTEEQMQSVIDQMGQHVEALRKITNEKE
jgi:AbrB family looped-hinge helix DNA binding protein